jgi:Guanylate kinase
MKQFKFDIKHWKDYDYTVINDKIEKCYKQIISYIKKRKKTQTNLKFKKKIIKNHINKLIN